MSQEITNLYAWIATQSNGDESLPATELVIRGRGMVMPLIGADMERMISLRGDAVEVKALSGVRMRLCRFQLIEELEEI
jgi:hypothetical protein